MARAAPRVGRPPNIVLIIVDTLRPDHLGCYGYSRPTSPNIDRLAGQGVLFEAGYSPASWTMPALMSIFTGLSPDIHECIFNEAVLPTSILTLAQRLTQKGYFCAAAISNPTAKGELGFGRGFELFDAHTCQLKAQIYLSQLSSCSVEYTDTITSKYVTDLSIPMLARARQSGRPWFLCLLYFDPHMDYVPPVPYNRLFDPQYIGTIDGRGVGRIRHKPPRGADLAHLEALYDGEVAFADAQIGRFLEALDGGADTADMLTILLADHGEAFAEHNCLTHGISAYREEVAVPMIWRWPEVLPAGRRVGGAVSTLSVAKTLAELLNLPDVGLLQGRSLWAAMSRTRAPDDWVWSERGKGEGYHLAVVKGDYRVHAVFDARPDEIYANWECFDLLKDPWEQHPRPVEEVDAVDGIKDMILSQWTQNAETRAYFQRAGAGGRIELDEEERSRLRSLGYIGGN